MKKISLKDACDECGLEEKIILDFIAEEWVTPVDEGQLNFDEDDLARIHLIQELKSIFEVNNQGIEVVLHLVDQLNQIHYELGEIIRKKVP